MSDGRRRFEVIAPDWGQAHLTSDAIVAFVDGELTDGAHTRASRHIEVCPECQAEVVTQGQARALLRSAQCPTLPSALLSALRSIPRDADLPAPPPGLAMGVDGQFVHTPGAAGPNRRRTGQRRMRFGAGAVASGLALGALVLGVSAAPSAPAAAPPAERGVFGGSLLGGSPGQILDARLQVVPTGPSAVTNTVSPVEPLSERLDRMPASFITHPGRP
ncbi:MAG: anti-sigma factor family protein [Pseudonocardia sp.]